MVINGTYVNESIIARMSFVHSRKYNNGLEERTRNSYVDILTTYGSQIQVNCTKKHYTDALVYLEKHRHCICGHCGGNGISNE